MTQPNLLEFARQGDPEAIAALMNLTLEPRGVTARANLEADCLQVFLTSPRTLNRATLVSFIQKGLASLGVESIQTVKIHGQKSGEEVPAWTEEFAVGAWKGHTQAAPSEDCLKDRSADSPSSMPTGISTDAAYASSKPSPLQLARDTFSTKLTTLTTCVGDLHSLAVRTLPQFRAQSHLNPILLRSSQMTSRLRHSKNFLRRRRQPYYALIRLALVLLPISFVLGALVAVIDAYVRGSTQRAGANSLFSGTNANSQMAIKSEAELAILHQQMEVRKYLGRMTKAQKNFYAQNGRFASSLEELERSTDIISLSSEQNNYVYRLTLQDEAQVLLTAVPKAGGLRSFAGTVFLSLDENGSDVAVATICESKQPSKTAPVLSSVLDGPVQCPADTRKI